MVVEPKLIAPRKNAGQRRNARWSRLFFGVVITAVAPNALADDSHSGELKNEFSVQVTEPYPTTSSSSSNALSLDERQILDLACRCNTSAALVQSLANVDDEGWLRSSKDQKREIAVCLIARVTSQRLIAERAAAALKGHLALAATRQATDLLQRTESELLGQNDIQSRLIDAGVSIPDDLLLARLSNELSDSKLEVESKDRQLRINLASLLSSSIACSYTPLVTTELMPCDVDVCEYVDRAMSCHYELIALTRLKGMLGPDTIDLGNELLALVAKVPSLPLKQASVRDRLRSILSSSDNAKTADRQKNWMSSLVTERKKEITRDIEIAYEKKKTAALRWSVESQQLQVWTRRIEQLEKLGTENRGNIAELGAAKLARLKQESRLIERWLDWQTAEVELMQACGDGFGCQ